MSDTVQHAPADFWDRWKATRETDGRPHRVEALHQPPRARGPSRSRRAMRAVRKPPPRVVDAPPPGEAVRRRADAAQPSAAVQVRAVRQRPVRSSTGCAR
jgi:hypothetical protein